MSQAAAKSRLGLLLVKKGLLTEKQLDDALKVQLTSGLRLGEVLISQGLLTERQLQKALKKQNRHRFLAAIIAMILGPLSMGAFANQSNQNQESAQTSNMQIDQYKGLQALDDDSLDGIQGQGLISTHFALNSTQDDANNTDAQSQLDAINVLSDIATALNPMSALIDADVSVTGVKYFQDKAQAIVHEDGSIELALPKEIAEIAFKNMRVKGDTQGASLGDIVISDIRFSEQSSMRIRIRP